MSLSEAVVPLLVECAAYDLARCNDAGNSGFADAGRAVEDHVGNLAALDSAAENLIFAE